jgi:tape measure domain-containing protein
MPQFTINFSNNASATINDLNRVVRAVSRVERVGQNITLNLDTSSLSRQINATFGGLNRQIENAQRRLNRLQIGGSAFRSTQASIGYREGQRERGELIGQSLRLRGQAQSFEGGSLVRFRKELEALQIEASQIRPNSPEWVLFQRQIGQIQTELKKADQAAESIRLREALGAFAPNSLNHLQTRLKLLRNEASQIAPDTNRWRLLNREIQQIERGVERVNRRPLTTGQRAGAAGGAFLYGGGLGGGIGSAVGGIAGGLAGGVPGAFAGAAVGQIADNLGTALAGITSQAAAVQKMQRGLAMASVDAKDFAEAQAAVGEMSQKLLMPLEQTTKYFAQLRANTKEYNLSVADTKEILEGTALAIMATGGSAEDLDGAMRAVVQIMSKGGVQAEELRGQLGERFPGAVVKFAQANKMSFEELQAGLEAGTIGIREFINFAKKNYTDYAKFSEQLAIAPEYAGQRLKIALEQISLEIGGLFGPMGADIQDLLTGTINNIAQFIKDNRAYLRQMISDFSSIVGPIAKVFVELMKVIANFSVQVGKIFQGLFAGIRQALGMASIGEARVRLEKAKAAAAGKTRPTRNARGGGTTTSAEFIELEAAQRAFSGMGGQAAFDKANAPAQPSNLTFGGAGAGMSIDRAAPSGGSGGAKAQKAKELQDYIRNEQDFLRQLAQIAQNRLEITMGLSNEELNILKSQAEFRASNATNEQQYLEDQRNAAEYSVATRDQYLKDIKEKYDNEKTLIQQQFDQSAYAPFLALERQLIGENEELAASLDALRQGRLDLTAEERIGLQVSKELRARESAGLAITPAIIQSIKDKAKAQDAYNQSLSYGKTILALQNQLALAQILDPRAERRAQIRQENPGLSDMQVENQAALEEQVAAAAQSRDQLRSIASSIGDAFGTAFKGIRAGTSSAREALAGLFQSIADSFADMVAKMLAEWAKTQIIKGLQMILGAIIPGMGGGFTPLSNEQATSFNFNPGAMTGGTPWAFANGGIAPGGFTAFANGGMVTGPTMGLVGEGRYNEAIVPLPDGKSIPVQLAGGDGGNQIISNITVNVNNGQAQSNATGSNSSEMGRKIEGAVKQVIVGELRPGGLLASR